MTPEQQYDFDLEAHRRTLKHNQHKVKICELATKIQLAHEDHKNMREEMVQAKSRLDDLLDELTDLIDT